MLPDQFSMELINKQKRPFELSVILPIYNEEDNVEILCDEIKQVLDPLNKSYEVLLVDDGSTDETVSRLKKIAASHSAFKVILFSRNFGQTAAMAAGFHYAQGGIYITMDADRQNDPKSIPALLEKMEEGFDVVSGWRKKRKDKLFSRRIPSMIANWLISKFTSVHLKDYGCSLKAYKSEYIDSIKLYGEMHRFIPAFAKMSGAKITQIPVGHRARVAGKSKYGLSRVFKVLMDLMTVKFLSSYATKPNYLFGGWGTLFCSLGLFSALEVLIEKFWIGTYAHKNPFLLLAVFLFILGLQLFLMGLSAEIQMRTYHEAQNKDIFLVKELINI